MTVNIGDIWGLGRHRLGCLDNGDLNAWGRLIDGTPIDAVITDPPYGINFDTDGSGRPEGKKGRKYEPVYGDNVAFDPSPWLLYKQIVLFGSNYYPEKLPPGGALIWDKRYLSGASYMADAEIAYFNGGQGCYIYTLTSQGGYFPDAGRFHPTQKPIGLMAWCMSKAKAGKVVIDPYSGSGSTLMACEYTDRVCLASEIEVSYVQQTLTRFWKATGKKPILLDRL